jgi:hypothetical protein
MSAWAAPGAKCVCVDASHWNATSDSLIGWAELPVEGEVYEIREVVNWLGDTGLRLVGVNNPLIPCLYGEIAFNVTRFRPLITRTEEEDVAKFRHLLTPSPIGARLVPAGVELDA